MAKTYEPIATTTLGSSQSMVTFSSFSGYTDLEIVIQCSRSQQGQLGIRFNNDSSSLYSLTYTYGSGGGASAVSGRTTSGSFTFIDFGYTQPSLGQQIYRLQIPQYSNSSTYKTLLGRQSYNSIGDVLMEAGLYRSTSAITRIDFVATGGTYDANSIFTLYGIKAA